MNSTELTTLFFAVFNSLFFFGLLMWIVRYRLVPIIRYDIKTRDNKLAVLSDEVGLYVDELVRAEVLCTSQECEIARLIVCMEKWAGVRVQRAAYAEQERRLLFVQYMKQREENECARIIEETKNLISEQVIKQARIELERKYAQMDMQQTYMDALLDYMVKRDNHG